MMALTQIVSLQCGSALGVNGVAHKWYVTCSIIHMQFTILLPPLGLNTRDILPYSLGRLNFQALILLSRRRYSCCHCSTSDSAPMSTGRLRKRWICDRIPRISI